LFNVGLTVKALAQEARTMLLSEHTDEDETDEDDEFDDDDND
jgi:hypothetical protein